MAGHSKWANIKHKKAAQDAKRGKQFTKLIKEITVAAKSSGDPAANPRLRQLIDKAKAVNMPADNIARAIKKGTGELPGVSYEEIQYEGYGPHGIAVIVEVLTDNRNRAAAEIRHIFTHKGGSLAETGAVNWMFNKTGVVRATGGTLSEDELLEQLLDYEVTDISRDEDLFTILCHPKSLDQVKKAVIDAGLHIETAETEWVASNPMELNDDAQKQAVAFLDILEDHDDVQNVYTNLA